jgi:hypothetical protein
MINNLVIFIHLFSSVLASFYFIDINNPFLLTPTSINITTIDPDYLTNSFLVGFQDGQARRYSPDFSSYTSLPAPEIVDKFSSWSIALSNILLSNGTTFSMLGNMTVSLSNQFQTIRVYSYPAHLQI